jgi:hypothetical protein
MRFFIIFLVQTPCKRTVSSCVFMLVPSENLSLIYDIYSDKSLILTIIALKWCVDVGVRPHVCRVF